MPVYTRVRVLVFRREEPNASECYADSNGFSGKSKHPTPLLHPISSGSTAPSSKPAGCFTARIIFLILLLSEKKKTVFSEEKKGPRIRRNPYSSL
jgi:hypothetical protein